MNGSMHSLVGRLLLEEGDKSFCRLLRLHIFLLLLVFVSHPQHANLNLHFHIMNCLVFPDRLAKTEQQVQFNAEMFMFRSASWACPLQAQNYQSGCKSGLRYSVLRH